VTGGCLAAPEEVASRYSPSRERAAPAFPIFRLASVRRALAGEALAAAVDAEVRELLLELRRLRDLRSSALRR